MTTNEAFVTLSTNDTYCLGALVLGHSLRDVKTRGKLVILISPYVSEHMRAVLRDVFDEVCEVNVIDNKDPSIMSLTKYCELGITLTKLHCWTLTNYSKCVFLDSDTLVLKNIDELFEKEELSAVSDIGWPDCFNSGVFVFKPSQTTFLELVSLLEQKGSFDGGDQGLLNTYFSDWDFKDLSKRLSYIYNMSSVSVHSYFAAYKQFMGNVKVVQFMGSMKPWMYGYDMSCGQIKIPRDFGETKSMKHVSHWWNIFKSKVQPRLSPDCNGLAAALSHLTVAEESTRKEKWEAGSVDYLGHEKFENIQKKLDAAIAKRD